MIVLLIAALVSRVATKRWRVLGDYHSTNVPPFSRERRDALSYVGDTRTGMVKRRRASGGRIMYTVEQQYKGTASLSFGTANHHGRNNKPQLPYI